jgi:ribosomal protein L12E/L44/L45/RPP1/RPP2
VEKIITTFVFKKNAIFDENRRKYLVIITLAPGRGARQGQEGEDQQEAEEVEEEAEQEGQEEEGQGSHAGQDDRGF